VWSPEQYRHYADERRRPFLELLNRIGADAPSYVVDLGCGPGALTKILLGRWPTATIEGIDSSPEMIRAAQEFVRPGLSFELGDIAAWTPRRPVDVLMSNAALQWVPGHLELMPRLIEGIVPGGWLGFQVPGNFDSPSHTLLHDLRNSSRWRSLVGDDRVPGAGSAAPADYLARLVDLGCSVDAWETTYLHVLPGEDAVLDWVKGTALRPILDALGEGEDHVEFVAEYAAALRAAYPRHPYGTVFPFRRIFVVARISPAAGRRRNALRSDR
jgi:trans-aconitate 2-methyltransferase